MGSCRQRRPDDASGCRRNAVDPTTGVATAVRITTGGSLCTDPLTFALLVFLIVVAFVLPGTPVMAQTPAPEGPSMAPANPVTATQPITRAISPLARVAMSVTVGISRSIQSRAPPSSSTAWFRSSTPATDRTSIRRLTFTGVSPAAKSLALTLEDPDAPSGLYVHWVIFNLPPS